MLWEELRMEQWEYMMGYVSHRENDGRPSGYVLMKNELEKTLNEYGADGWELVSFPPELLTDKAAEGYVLFKRRKINEKALNSLLFGEKTDI